MACQFRKALVVDDEVFARIMVADILAGKGIDSLEAETAVEALDVLDTHGGVSLLITDVCMPGDRDGLALAWKVYREFPHIKIVIVSGQARPSFVDMPAGSKFLAKPFTAQDLSCLVDAAA